MVSLLHLNTKQQIKTPKQQHDNIKFTFPSTNKRAYFAHLSLHITINILPLYDPPVRI